jgi:hypothetical protein
MQVRARQEVGQDVVVAVSMAGIEVNVLCRGNRIDLAQEAG